MPEVPVMDLDVLDPLDAWRLLNSILATAGMVALIRRIRAMWNDWTARMRYLSLALGLFLATVIEGSIEHIVYGNQFGVMSMLTTVACAWTLHALIHTPPGYTAEPPKYPS